MKIRFFLLVAAASALIGPLVAGTLELQPKETAPPTVTESEPWQFTIAVPGWLSSMDGTIGVRGVNANIDVPVTEILQHFDAILAGRVEAQKGPFGIFGEVIYIGLSDGAQINGLINNIHETVDLTYVDGALSWRLVNQPRWSLDFAAGTHYTTVYEQLELHSDPTLIQQTSEQFVTNISDDLEARLNNDISNKDFLATVGSTIESDIVSQIDKHNSLDRHQRNPRIPIGPLGGRIEEDVANVFHDFIVAKETALRIRIDALHLQGEARRAAVTRADRDGREPGQRAAVRGAAVAQRGPHPAARGDELRRAALRQEDLRDGGCLLRRRRAAQCAGAGFDRDLPTARRLHPELLPPGDLRRVQRRLGNADRR